MSYYPSWYSEEDIKRIEEEERKRMKGIRGSIIAGVAIVLVIILMAMCSVRVPAGYVAVQYSLNGGVKDKVLTQGWHFIPPTVHATKYTVGIEQSYLTKDDRGDSAEDDSYSASSAEGKALDIELTYTYQYQPENVTAVFTRFKGQSGKEVKESFIKPNIISWSKEVIAKYNVADILGAEKATVNKAITDYVSQKFEPYGITISNVSLINVGVDKKTREVINDKIAAQQKAETQKIENQTKVEKAEADAKAKLIEAEAEAEANRLLQKSLTDGVLKQQYIEKWNGELPKVSSEGSMMYNLNDME